VGKCIAWALGRHGHCSFTDQVKQWSIFTRIVAPFSLDGPTESPLVATLVHPQDASSQPKGPSPAAMPKIIRTFASPGFDSNLENPGSRT